MLTYKSILERDGITVFPVTSHSVIQLLSNWTVSVSPCFRIRLQTFSDFQTYCEQAQESFVFMDSILFPNSDYIISYDLVRSVTSSDAEFDFVQKWAEQENLIVLKQIHDMPTILASLFGTLSGVYYLEVCDAALSELAHIPTAKSRLTDFLKKTEEERFSLFLDNHELWTKLDAETALRLKFRIQLYGDTAFTHSPDADSRTGYVSEFIRKPENKPFLQLGHAVHPLHPKSDTSNTMFLAMLTLMEEEYQNYRKLCDIVSKPFGAVLTAKEVLRMADDM